MDVEYTRRAVRELDELLAYVAQQDPLVSLQISAAVEKQVLVIQRTPRLFARTSRANVFRCPLSRYGVTIVYRFRPKLGRIEILKVTRGSRIQNLSRPER